MLHYDDYGNTALALDAQPGPAKRISSAQAGAMIESALDAVYTPAAVPRARRRWPTLILAAAVVGAAGAAAAGAYRYALRGDGPEVAPPAQRRDVTAPLRAEDAAEPDAGDDAADGDENIGDAASHDTGEPAAQAPADPPATIGDIKDDTAGQVADTPAPAAPSRTRRPPASASLSTPRTPEDLMQLANDQRRARRWTRADASYQRLVREHAGTHAAYVAGIASAGIRLDHLGDARGALRLYRAALRQRPAGALAEEARYGVAEALRRLGDTAGERRALQDFLSHHAGSPLTPRARDRLDALTKGPKR